MKLKCSKCEKNLDSSNFYPSRKKKRGFTYLCKKCEKNRQINYDKTPQRKEYVRNNLRKRYLKLITNKKMYGRYLCRLSTRVAISRGKIKRLPCKICGNPKTVVHHLNYRRKNPKIIFLCHLHHNQIHSKLI